MSPDFRGLFLSLQVRLKITQEAQLVELLAHPSCSHGAPPVSIQPASKVTWIQGSITPAAFTAVGNLATAGAEGPSTHFL